MAVKPDIADIHSSIFTPEYLAFQKCYQVLVTTIKNEPGAFCDALFARGFISESVRDFARNRFISDEEKAQKFVDTLIDRIKVDVSVFHGFIEIVKRPSTSNIVEMLQQSYETECEKLSPVLDSYESEKHTDSSDCESFHSCAEEVCSDGFLCPYCKKCTMEQFFSDKGCPQKKQLSDSKAVAVSLFPYLDASALPNGKGAALEMQLRSETRVMITRFADFTVLTRESLDTRKVSLEKIKDTILSLEAFTEDIGVKLLEPRDRDNIRKASSVAEIFITLRDYISFFNYQIIEHLIKHHGSTDDQKRQEEYLDSFNTFCQRSIFEVPTNIFSNSPCQYGRLFALKCTERVATLNGIQGVKERIAQVFGLQPLALHLRSIKKGCIELHFLISAAVADHILPVSPSQHSALSEIGVRVLSCEKMSSTNIQDDPESDMGADSLDLQETRVLHQKSLPVAHREVSPPLQKSQGVAPDQTLHSSSDDDSEFKKRMRAITVEMYRKQVGESPLLISCVEGHTENTRQLIDKGADVNECDQLGRSPLFFASEGGHTKTVKLLIDNGADINNSYKWKLPLIAACEEGHTDTVQLLIDNGADINKSSKSGDSPLLAACGANAIDIVTKLIDNGADIHKSNESGDSPLLAACEADAIDIIKKLIDNGADINKSNESGVSPLLAACTEGGEIKIVELLIKSGADIDICDEYGESPLLAACKEEDDIEIVECLVENGADVNKCDEPGNSPLLEACRRGNTKITKLLIDKGAEVTMCNKSEVSPLSAASGSGSIEIVQLLIDKGADLNKCDKRGESPLLHACNVHRMVMGKWLHYRMRESEMAVHYNPQGHAETLLLLANKGADVNKSNKSGESPFLITCLEGHTDTARLFIDKGADVNKTSVISFEQHGRSPLLVACDGGHTETAMLLIEKGADINKCDKRGRSLLQAALECKKGEIAQLLVSKGANATLDEKEAVESLLLSQSSHSRLTPSTVSGVFRSQEVLETTKFYKTQGLSLEQSDEEQQEEDSHTS